MLNKTINLLVVDDDDINIFIIKKIVEKTGYAVNMVSRSNGQLAIEYLSSAQENKEQFPDLMLIDINMPILNGWEFIEAFEAQNITSATDMYMLSSSVYENDIEKAKGYKTVKGFISKPLSLDRLKELFYSISIKLS